MCTLIEENAVILLVYVDDLILISKDIKLNWKVHIKFKSEILHKWSGFVKPNSQNKTKQNNTTRRRKWKDYVKSATINELISQFGIVEAKTV